MSKPTRPPISGTNGAGCITQLERWLGEYDLLVPIRSSCCRGEPGPRY
jgi:hypothetical protein